MSGLVKFIRAQFGLSPTPANNYTLRNPADGTLRLARGNSGAELQDVFTVQADNGLLAAASPATGNRTNLLATMQKFADEFGSSLVQSGYQRLPSGLIIQWDRGPLSASVVPGGGTTQAFVFPIAFPNAVLCAVAESETGAGAAMHTTVNSITTTGLTVALANRAASGNGTAYPRYLAFGY